MCIQFASMVAIETSSLRDVYGMSPPVPIVLRGDGGRRLGAYRPRKDGTGGQGDSNPIDTSKEVIIWTLFTDKSDHNDPG
jgi:hypothetical protein